MTKRFVVAMVLIGALLTVSGAGAYTSGLQPPANFNCQAVDETTIHCDWGPTQPGKFSAIAADNKSVTIGWPASLDSQPGAITYCASKNGAAPTCGLSQPQYKVSGINKNVKSFQICVYAMNGARVGATGCTTFNRS